MSSSCSGSACETSKGEVVADICAECGEKGTTVDPITLKALLAAEGLRRGVPPNPRFCASANCPVVYFDRGVVFREADLIVPVHANIRPMMMCRSATASASPPQHSHVRSRSAAEVPPAMRLQRLSARDAALAR